MKKAISVLLLFSCVLVLFLSGVLSAQQRSAGQKKDSLAVFPFTGGSASDGDALASSLARQAALRNAFNRTIPVTRAAIASRGFEQRFQRSGLTDPDSIFELGRQLGASHVIAGHITRLGNRNLVVISVMDVESLQKVAGEYRSYGAIEEMSGHLSAIAQRLAAGALRDTSRLPGLSVPPFVLGGGVNQSDAMVLAQILACELANGNKYAVLPRTDSVEKVLEEHRRQRGGDVAQERIRRLGAGRNARYVLSGSVQRLGNINHIATDVLNIEEGDIIDGHEEEYTNLSEGLELIPRLAAQLVGAGSVPAGGNFMRIFGGAFTMGSPTSELGRRGDEGQRQVTVNPFLISKYPVTQKEFQEVMGRNPSHFKGEDRPVENVTWFEAIEYCNRRSQREGLTQVYTVSGNDVTWNRNANGYRLPTEAEWEYACRAGTTTAYSFGNDAAQLGNYAWFGGNSGGMTHPVGTKLPNPWGLYDMHGNVWEWCWDWHTAGTWRVSRGGSWNYTADLLRSADRSNYLPSDRDYFIGFRVVRNIQ